jgi:hypothetical protein
MAALQWEVCLRRVGRGNGEMITLAKLTRPDGCSAKPAELWRIAW